jgi:hypothetical protein
VLGPNSPVDSMGSELTHGDRPKASRELLIWPRTVICLASRSAPPTAQERQIPDAPLGDAVVASDLDERASPQVPRLRNQASLLRPERILGVMPHFDMTASKLGHEGAQHPDRDAQFRHLNSQVEAHLAAVARSCCRLAGCAIADFGQP